MSKYDESIHAMLWAWADKHHQGQLDDKVRTGPVLRRDLEIENVVIPPNGLHANKIRGAIPEAKRHRWFGSLKSSQALAQSVFAAIEAFDRYDILAKARSECGRVAFFESYYGWSLALEHEVATLNERPSRRTNIDVLMGSPSKRVAVECKFTETGFGKCSRPDQQKDSPQYCDGNYHTQQGRNSRCALSEYGIKYWDYLPQLFDWAADQDHVPCPFGDVYQIARNAIAATLTDSGELEPDTGHALLVYDRRNPAFQQGGEGNRQWRAATAACLIPSLLRRVSWQSLLTPLALAPELKWLVDGLEQKYGITAE